MSDVTHQGALVIGIPSDWRIISFIDATATCIAMAMRTITGEVIILFPKIPIFPFKLTFLFVPIHSIANKSKGTEYIIGRLK